MLAGYCSSIVGLLQNLLFINSLTACSLLLDMARLCRQASKGEQIILISLFHDKALAYLI